MLRTPPSNTLLWIPFIIDTARAKPLGCPMLPHSWRKGWRVWTIHCPDRFVLGNPPFPKPGRIGHPAFNFIDKSSVRTHTAAQ